MNNLLHFGNPKTASTSLQGWFLQDTNNNFFMGKGPLSHIPAEVQQTLESEILCAPSYLYDEAQTQRIFAEAREKAKAKNVQTFIVSDENIVAPLGDGYESHLARYRAVMPEDTVGLLVIREQVSFLKSYYKHRVTLEGMTSSFDDFLKYQLIKGKKGVLAMLDYCSLANTARQYFPNLEIILFEDFIADNQIIHKTLAKHDIHIKGDIPKSNAGRSDAEAYHFTRLYQDQGINLQRPQEFTLHPDDITQILQGAPVFDSLMLREKVRVATMKALLDGASLRAKQEPDATLDYSISAETEAMLAPTLANLNAALADTYDLDIKKRHYVLPD